jgi:hypothetical protein
MPKIKYHPREEFAETIVPPPTPASKSVPEWFKKLEGIIDKNKPHRFPNNQANKTIKMCVPVIDALTAGYMITLPCDVAFVDPAEYEGRRILWDVSWTVCEYHSTNQLRGMPLYEKYDEIPWKWNVPWSIETPKGYSLLFTHPLNRMELPFVTMSGIVDTDEYECPVNLPFLIREGFMGIIPKGTPIAQVIPIKREKWTSESIKFTKHISTLYDDLRSVINGSYRLRWWHKKSYD